MKKMIPAIETASHEMIQRSQEEKLEELLQYLAKRSPFYKEHFRKHGININTIRRLEDLVSIPTIDKTDLQQFNDNFLCVSREDIIDFSATSGTTGNPVTFALTEKDLERLAYNEAISLACTGIRKGDTVQLMTTMDRQFMAGLAYFQGLRKLGAGIIRTGAGIPELQWNAIIRYQPQYLITIPSFLLKMIEYAEQNGIDYKGSSVKGIICIGEALREQDLSPSALCKRIAEKWKVALYSTYASTEMNTAFTECIHQQGGHHHPELIIAEVLDDAGMEVPYGEAGELTVSTLGIEGMPLLRFRTGDIVIKHTEPCACGRNTFRIGPVLGRKQQMIKYKGTTLYPPALENVLHDMPDITAYYIEINSNETGTDEILIRIAASDQDPVLLDMIKDRFRAKIRVTPKVELESEASILKRTLNPSGRKPVRYFDNRK